MIRLLTFPPGYQSSFLFRLKERDFQRIPLRLSYLTRCKTGGWRSHLVFIRQRYAADARVIGIDRR